MRLVGSDGLVVQVSNMMMSRNEELRHGKWIKDLAGELSWISFVARTLTTNQVHRLNQGSTNKRVMKKSDRRSENVGGFKVMDKDRRQQEQDEI
jgi:hypothetical protein